MDDTVISVTRLDGKPFHISPHQIEYMESNPDTTLIMLSGKRLVVRETPEQIIARIVEYRSKLASLHNEV